ncbi:hypothetical protein HJC23_013999 [Cyclotella cryptica]|uniref:Transmembrane protein n=1 Tax=Cyclotella cryptica TaxID=29204 RepID=A0ABD3NHR8_9STRA|eukprot:CCRYP_021010-RA/>CCRYP_021010-RA protein AED:0.30 eAED:0.30 QI:243/1/1/1/0.5/0.33/3/265/293
MMNCLRVSCTNARRELTSPMFDLSEPAVDLASTEGGVLTSSIDVSKTFCPRPRIPFIATKVFLSAWVIAMMALSIEQTQFESFWLAYLTHWGWTVTVAYFLSSLGTACYFSKCELADGAGRTSGVLIKLTWGLLAIALPGEVVICLLFWFLEFDGTVRYVSLMLHGIGIVLIVIDGILINRIPLRIKQFFLFEAFSALYLVWNVAFSFSGLGNPYKESGAQDDDAIYSSMRWKTNTSSAVTVAVLVLLVANPILFLLCRAMSRLLPMRLIATETKSGEIELGFSQNVGEPEQV